MWRFKVSALSKKNKLDEKENCNFGTQQKRANTNIFKEAATNILQEAAKNILKGAATNDPLPTAFLNISAFLEVEHSSKPRCTDQ